MHQGPCFSGCNYLHEAKSMKNNIGIIGNDTYENKIRTMGKVLEGMANW